MHELVIGAHVALLAVDPPSDGSDNSVKVALIITAGTVVSGLFALLVAAFQRERSPRSTAAANSNNNPAGEQGTMLADLVTRLQTDFDELEVECNEVKRRFRLLRKAVRRRSLDPDDLIAAEEVSQ